MRLLLERHEQNSVYSDRALMTDQRDFSIQVYPIECEFIGITYRTMDEGLLTGVWIPKMSIPLKSPLDTVDDS